MPEKKKRFRKYLRLLTVSLLALILAMGAAGCGKKEPVSSVQEESSAAELTLIEESGAETEETDSSAENTANAGKTTSGTENAGETAAGTNGS